MSLAPTPAAATSETNPVKSPSARRWGRTIGLTLLAGVFAVLTWNYVLRDRLVAKRWGVVVPGLVFRSGQVSRFLIEPTLEQNRIRHIICMTSPDEHDANQQAEIAAARKLHIEHVFFPLNGRGVGKVENFTGAVSMLATNARRGEPVLVHCHAGTQRTGGVVAAYRLLIEKQSPEQVIEELEHYGWNRRRDQILIDFVNEHLSDAATELVAAGCLEQVPHPLPILR